MQRVAWILFVCAVPGLAQPDVSPAPDLTFEVASIKPDTSMGRNISLNRTPGGGLDATNVPARLLITFAYNISDHQLSGAPSWLDSERYDIHAKPPARVAAKEPSDFFDAPATERLRLRMQALLADRFQLVVHQETREMPVYALVVGRNGPKLAAWKEGDDPGPQIIGRSGTLTCKKVSMQRFAEGVLAGRLGRNVENQTGLSGDYNFKLEYDDAPPKTGSDPADTASATRPTFLDALQEQLGLKLEHRKGPVEVLVIDHVERASAN
jgi:uncharacterized protein (TIGR03435 family)